MRGDSGGPARSGNPASRRRSGTSVAAYAGLGLQFVAVVLAGLYAGQWLDRRFGTEPWLMIAGVFLGAGGAFWAMYRRLMADLAHEEEERRQ